MVFQLSLVIIATHYNNKVSVSSSVNYCYASNTIGHIFFPFHSACYHNSKQTILDDRQMGYPIFLL